MLVVSMKGFEEILRNALPILANTFCGINVSLYNGYNGG